jgi:hypothetical protein
MILLLVFYDTFEPFTCRFISRWSSTKVKVPFTAKITTKQGISPIMARDPFSTQSATAYIHHESGLGEVSLPSACGSLSLCEHDSDLNRSFSSSANVSK